MHRTTRNTRHEIRWLTVGLAALALVATACGAVSENLAEEIIEQGFEGEGNANVDLDLEDGTVNIDVEGPEGQSISIGGGEVPDEITVPIPDGGDVTTSYVGSNDAAVALFYPQSEFDALVAYYEDWVASQSEEFDKNTSTFSSDDGTIRNVTWYSAERSTNISVGDCYSLEGGLDNVCLNITMTG